MAHVTFLQKHKGSYDIIFADPPYHLDQKDFEKIPTLIFENEILEEEGMLIIEHSKDTKLEHLDTTINSKVSEYAAFESDSTLYFSSLT